MYLNKKLLTAEQLSVLMTLLGIYRILKAYLLLKSLKHTM